jgi:hypothetical protein
LLQVHLKRGDRCPATKDLGPALLTYASYSSIVHPVPLLGRLHSIAGIADAPSTSAHGKRWQATTRPSMSA